MSVSYDNIYSQDIVDTIMADLRSEFGGSTHCYYGDTFERKSNKAIRVLVVNQTHGETNYQKFCHLGSLVLSSSLRPSIF